MWHLQHPSHSALQNLFTMYIYYKLGRTEAYDKELFWRLKPMIKNNSEDLKSGLDCGFSYTSLVLNVLTTNSRLFWLLFIITSSWWPGHSWTLASVVCHDHCCHILKFMRNYYDCSLQSFGVQKFGSDGQGGIYLTILLQGTSGNNVALW